MELITVQEGLSAWLEEKRRTLVEGEVGNAEVLLAAKDMVDSIQDMIEDVSKMQNEQMPALIDTIRDQIGTEQADQFKGAVGQVLGIILQQLTDAREQTDNAARNLAGEGSPDMGMGGGADLGPDLGAPEGGDLEGGDLGAVDAAAGAR